MTMDSWILTEFLSWTIKAVQQTTRFCSVVICDIFIFVTDIVGQVPVLKKKIILFLWCIIDKNQDRIGSIR